MASKFDDSSDDEESIPTSAVSSALLPPQPTAGVEELKEDHEPPTPTIMNNDETPPVHLNLTKYAEALEKDKDSAMAELHDPKLLPEGDNVDNSNFMIQHAIQTHVEPLVTCVRDTESQLFEITQKYHLLVIKHDESTQKLLNL